ncbi:MAG: hypothetical protein IPN01_24425 [Deltaproteobacteria bacterium]|nr:hypothetical protein [Deltaproteobacteria bacterium]
MSRRDQDRWDKPKRQRTQRFAPAEPMQGWEEERPTRHKRRRDKARPLVEVPEARDRRPGGEFGRAAQLGDNSEIATKKGYRAAVIPLRKGLFLVAELPVEATKSEFGVVPLLGPLMVKAAVKALTGSGEERREARRDDPDRPRLLERLRPQLRAPRDEEAELDEAEALLGWSEGDDFGCAKCGGGCGGGRRP